MEEQPEGYANGLFEVIRNGQIQYYVLELKRRRHIVGGVLLSISLLFGGLAVTTITIKPEVRK